MIVFAVISLKLENVGPNISSFLIHIDPCHPLQQRRVKVSMPNHSLKSQNWTIIFKIQLMWRHRPLKGNPRQSWIVDSIPWIQDSRHWIPDSNQWWDSRFLDLYSAFQSPRFQNPQIFPGFWIPQAKISWIPESKTVLDSGFLTLYSWFQILDSIFFVSGIGIPFNR